MSTTTIRIEDGLKARVAVAAEQAGKTPHAFIVEAIAQTVEQAEAQAAFHQLADQRWDRLKESGKSVGWDDARAYLAARVGGQRVRKPTARRVSR